MFFHVFSCGIRVFAFIDTEVFIKKEGGGLVSEPDRGTADQLSPPLASARLHFVPAVFRYPPPLESKYAVDIFFIFRKMFFMKRNVFFSYFLISVTLRAFFSKRTAGAGLIYTPAPSLVPYTP
jgi:hypothetical protein